ELQPDMVTMENVPLLTSHKVFSEFLELLQGYSVHWSIVECANIGIPQTRKRLVVVASRLGEIKLDVSTAKPESPRTVRDEIGKLPAITAGQQHRRDRLHYSSTLSEMNMKRIKASKPGGTWRDWDPELIAACHRK